MKKQRFLLVLLLAFVAGISSAYAQCNPDGLHPAPGVEYDYTATVSGPGYDGTGGTEYDWYITQNLDVLDAASFETPGPLFTVAAATPYHNPGSGINHILITWSAIAVADPDPFYLVLRYKEDNSLASPTCGAENIRVWEIKPINTFLLAFEGGMLSGANYAPIANSNTCAAGVTGAVVTQGTPSTVLLTYGQNSLYYVATASGIVGNWKPWISIPALQATQTYVSAEWTADMTGAGGWATFGAAATGAAQTLQSATDATCSNVAGTQILIRIVINNNNWQTLANQTVNVGLDGFLPTAYTISDIIGTGATPCDPATPFLRTATFTINARPTTGGTPVFLNNTNP